MSTNPNPFSGPGGPAGGVLTGSYPNPGLAATAGLQLQATTGAAGFALQNATPGILTWTAPNDGLLHRVLILASLDVTVAQTGGTVTMTIQDPGGSGPGTHTIYSGGLGTGSNIPNNPCGMIVKAGSAVTVQQGSAQTLGTATLYAELWGS